MRHPENTTGACALAGAPTPAVDSRAVMGHDVLHETYGVQCGTEAPRREPSDDEILMEYEAHTERVLAEAVDGEGLFV